MFGCVYLAFCCCFQIKVSAHCPIDLVKDMNIINQKLLPDIQVRCHHILFHLLPVGHINCNVLYDMTTPPQSPYLQPVLEVRYFEDEGQLAIVQPFYEQGSLKDFIYQVSFN